MISTSALIAAALVSLVIGICIGLLVARLFNIGSKPSSAEAKLNTLESEYTQYQQNVAQHFVDTSRLIVETQQRQKDLHEHLVSGALHLTSAEVSRSILEQADENQSLENNAALENIDPANLNPPKDWAPKAPGNEGILSEEFGLKEDNNEEDEEAIEVKTATPQNNA